MSPIFDQRFRVRFDECGPDGTVRAAACLRYVIETAFAHSAHAGFPLEWYNQRALHWLVRRVRLDLYEAVSYGAGLTVTTEVVGFRRIWARRHSTIQDSGGQLLGEAVVDWIFTDRRGSPARIIPEMQAAFPTATERAGMEIEHVEVGTAPEHVPTKDYLVPGHQIDPRGHMNSAAYLELFEDGLTEGGVDPQQRPARYEVEYLRPLVRGELLHRSIWAERDGWTLIGETAEAALVVKAHRGEPAERQD